MNRIDTSIIDENELQRTVQAALDEDVGSGDVTSNALVPSDERITANVVAREELIVSTASVAEYVFAALDSAVKVEHGLQDGTLAQAGDCVLEIRGNARAILTAERTILNFIQRMSGIATLTKRYVDAVQAWDAVILDTRKTTPGLRRLAKYAVCCGGGTNHRMGLYDKAMIKDNHRVFWDLHGADGLKGAVERIRADYPDVEVEVEVDKLDELREALKAEPEWILLDNMKPATLKKCVEINAGRSRLEASGGINLDTVADVAATGVDAISVGALTHSAVAVDLAMDFVKSMESVRGGVSV